jgi:hypothetical protein
MKKTVIIFLLIINLSAFGRNHWTIFNIDYPIITNSFSGRYSASINFHKQFSIKLPALKIGVSYSSLKNSFDKNLNNTYFNIGLCQTFDIKEKVKIYPYITAGYSIFKDDIINNNGPSLEIGTDIAKNIYFETFALHIAYRQNYLNDFTYEPKSQNTNGTTGMFLIGISYIL